MLMELVVLASVVDQVHINKAMVCLLNFFFLFCFDVDVRQRKTWKKAMSSAKILGILQSIG